jgi:hypothetical protein
MPKIPEQAWLELEGRWRHIFSTLHGGGEIPPGQRLRAEGFMEAVVLLELSTEAAVQDALEHCYRDIFGEPLRRDWRELFPFPQIPGFGQRAPVYPSTPD